MLFLAITDQGIQTQPINAAGLADAANQLKQLYGLGTGQVKIAVVLPSVVGTITQNPTDPALAMIAQTGDAANQATVIQQANTAHANNLTYLGIVSPTNAQVVAQVAALTRQMNGVIRLLVGDFSGTT